MNNYWLDIEHLLDLNIMQSYLNQTLDSTKLKFNTVGEISNE